MIRIYCAYEGVLCRTGREMKSFTKALEKARSMSLPAGVVEVRELTAKGTEILRACFKSGVPLGQ